MGLESREDEIKSKLAATPEPKVYLAPNMAEIYRQRVDGLQEAFAAGAERDQAHEAIRGLVDKVVLTPTEGVLRIDLHGEAAAILQLSAAGKKDPLGEGLQLVMVAGARSHLYRTKVRTHLDDRLLADIGLGPEDLGFAERHARSLATHGLWAGSRVEPGTDWQ